MALHAQIHGGPQDGAIVPFVGPYLRMPRRQASFTASWIAENVPPPNECSLLIDEYVLKRGWDGELYYVAPRSA